MSAKLQPIVLGIARQLVAEGLFPSVVAICGRWPGGKAPTTNTVRGTRAELIAAGALPAVSLRDAALEGHRRRRERGAPPPHRLPRRVGLRPKPEPKPGPRPAEEDAFGPFAEDIRTGRRILGWTRGGAAGTGGAAS